MTCPAETNHPVFPTWRCFCTHQSGAHGRASLRTQVESTEGNAVSYTPELGEKCQVVVPVHADYTLMKNHAAVVRDEAASALVRICQRHGFTPTDQELIWSGSVAAARNSPHSRAVTQLPDNMHVFVFEATAA